MSYIVETFIFVLMNFLTNNILFRRIAILISLIIVSLILWNTYTFFQKFKQEERIKMEILATAQKEIATNIDLNANVDLPLKVIESNSNIPEILPILPLKNTTRSSKRIPIAIKTSHSLVKTLGA